MDNKKNNTIKVKTAIINNSYQQLKNNKISIVMKGLNLLFTLIADPSKQTYSDDELNTKTSTYNSSYVTYNLLTSKLINNKKLNINENLFNKLKSKKSNNSVLTESYLKDFEIEFNLLLTRKGEEISNYFFKKLFMIVDCNRLAKLKEKFNLIICHSNPFFALVDKIILSLFDIDNYFNYMLDDSLYYEMLKSKPSSFIVIDNNLELLEQYHKEGCWSVYNASIFNNENEYDNNNQNFIQDLNNKNNSIIKKYFVNNSNNNIKFTFPDLTTIGLFNQEYCFDMIKEIVFNKNCINSSNIININNNINNNNNNKEQELICCNKTYLFNKLKETNPITVLVINRSLINPSAYKKSDFYISNENIIYYFFHGIYNKLKDNNDNNDNPFTYIENFDLFSIRFNDLNSLYYYKLLSNIINKEYENKLVNNLKKVEIILNRTLLSKEIKEFNKYFSNYIEQKIKVNNNSSSTSTTNFNLYNNKLSSHKVCVIKRKDLLYDSNNENKYKKEISDKLNMECIVKFNSSSVNEYNHINIFLCNSLGWDKLINDLNNNYNKDNNLEVIFEEYLPHDNHIIKVYWINNQCSINTRPSLPLEACSYLKEQGYLSFITKNIENKEFRKKIGLDKNVNSNDNKEEHLINNDQKDFINLVSRKFQEFSSVNLFGLDIVKSRNCYYIIDINYFPAYSEYKDKVHVVFSNHFTSVYRNKLKK